MIQLVLINFFLSTSHYKALRRMQLEILMLMALFRDLHHKCPARWIAMHAVVIQPIENPLCPLTRK